MTKEEIFQQVPWLTDSIFERLVEFGVITTVSKGKGKGRGQGSEKATYGDNTIEVLQMVERLESSVKREDLVYALLWRGFEIDFQKLHERLFLDFDRFKAYLNEMGAISEDTDLLKKAAKRQLFPSKQGKPSNAEKEMLKQEMESMREKYELVKRIVNKLPIGQQILSLADQESMGEEGVDMVDEWLSLDTCRGIVVEATLDDLKQVHRSIGVLRDIVGIFRQNSPDMQDGVGELMQFLMHPTFLKVYTFLMLIPMIRDMVLQFEEPESKETFAAYIKNPDQAFRLQGGES